MGSSPQNGGQVNLGGRGCGALPDLPHGLAGCQVRLAGQQVVDGGGQGVGVVEVVPVEREVGRVGQPGRDGSALVFESARGGY